MCLEISQGHKSPKVTQPSQKCILLLHQHGECAPGSDLELPGRQSVSCSLPTQHERLPQNLGPQQNLPSCPHQYLSSGSHQTQGRRCQRLPTAGSSQVPKLIPAGQRSGQILRLQVNNLDNAISVKADQMTRNSDFD